MQGCYTKVNNLILRQELILIKQKKTDVSENTKILSCLSRKNKQNLRGDGLIFRQELIRRLNKFYPLKLRLPDMNKNTKMLSCLSIIKINRTSGRKAIL